MCDQQSLRSACAYAQSDQSLCLSLEYSMIVKLLTEHHLEFLSLNGCCRGSSESTHVKMPHCWKSHALAQILSKHRNKLWVTRAKLSPCGPKFRLKWDPGRRGGLPKKIFFRETLCHSVTTQKASCGDNLLPLHHISPSI